MPEHTNDNPAQLTRCPLMKEGQCTSSYKSELPPSSSCPDTRGDYEFLNCRVYQMDVANKGVGVADAVNEIDEWDYIEDDLD